MKSVSELAISALQEALHAEAIELRLASAEALVQFTTGGQDEVVAVLAEIASGQSDNLRSKAIRSIGRLGPPAKHAVPALKRALEADSAGLRADAAHSLWLVDRDPAAVVAMAKLLSVPVEYQYAYNVPSTVAGRLGHIGPEAAAAVPALITALQHAHKTVREPAAGALGKIGQAARPAVPALLVLIEHADPKSTEEIANALKSVLLIDPDAAGPVIEKCPHALKALRNRDVEAASLPADKLIERYRKRK